MAKVNTVNGETHIQALVDKKKVIITETSVRSVLHLEDAEDEHVTTTSNDPLSGEDRLKLTELMELYTQLQSRGRKDQDMFDTSIFDDEEVVAEKEVSTDEVVPTFDEVVTTDDYDLAARLQEEERGELTIEEKSSEKAKEGSFKRAADNLKQEDAKRQRTKEENESAELKRCLEIIHEDDDDVIIKTIPLLLGLNNVLISFILMLFSFKVDAVEDFKEYMLRDYYCWLKTYCCWYKLKLLDKAACSRLRLLEKNAAADEKMKKLL
uniref:Uncharacterized protein n=1 Tax=Tanacetum cinerariifolium TaxID=118510 RepID=A0A6L2LAS4_TANCI|nr:hypothetical protein [Tanacetum cinerariifolium]